MKTDRKIEAGSNSSKSEADRLVHHLVPRIKSFSKYVGLAVSLIGLLVLSGWLLGIEQLKNVFAGLPAMKANTAIAFITAGMSLWLRGSTSPKMQTAAQVLGLITGLIGLLTLGEYVSGRNFGMDELIFKDLAASGVLHPGRMSFMSALNFTMMGMALLLLDSDNERRYNLGQSLTLVAGIIAYVALAGYLFDVDSLYRVGVFAPMAFHTSFSFILLFVGMVCAQPEGDWVGNLIADTPGGDLLRRLLPVAFVVPIILGWLGLRGQLAGYYETAFGTALLAVAITLFLSVIIWFNAKGLTRVDMDRRRVEQELRDSEEKYRTLFDSIDEGFCIIEKVESKAGEPLDFRYVVANPAFATQSGVGDVVGKTIRQAFPGELDEWFETYATILRTGEAIRFERNLATQGRVLELYAFQVEDGTHRRVAVIFKNITARKQAENRLALLVDISELTRKFEDPNELLFAVSKAIGEHLQVRRCLFNETDLENDREIVHRDYYNGVESVAGGHKLSDYSSVTSAEMEAGKTVVNCDSKIDARTVQDYEWAYAPNGERAYVAVPLMRENRWVASFWASDDLPRQWSKEEVSLLETVAERTWTATEKLRIDTALRASEERYRNLFDLVPVAVYACDANGLIQEFNHRAVELWGREPLKNDPKEKFCGSFKMFYPDGRFMLHEKCPMARMLRGETLEPHELEILVERPDGMRRNVLAHPLPLKNERGEIVGAINCVYDITERKQAEESLRESEERFHAILRQATAGIVRKDAEGKLMFVNQAFCNMLGYTESELLGKTIWQLTHNDDVDENRRLYDRTMMEGIPFKLEKRLMRQDGSTLWVDVSVSPVMDATGKPQSAVAVEVDITGRKQAEEALRDLNLQLESRVQNRTVKLQEANQSLLNEIAERQKVEEALHESRKRLQILSQRLVEVQEEERRAIARELHDSVGQSLSALNINLVILDNQISNYANEQIRTRLNDSMQLTAETINLVRDVMSDLRPAVLDDYGLEAALQSYMDQFKSRYGIKILFEKPDQPIRRLGSSIEMTFLRIAQEALLNIARHANADQVDLSLWQERNAIRLIVQDNGTGIESWQEANRPGSHGLTIMRERADAVGGNLRVISLPGKGTKVEVSIPIENGGQHEIPEERQE